MCLEDTTCLAWMASAEDLLIAGISNKPCRKKCRKFVESTPKRVFFCCHCNGHYWRSSGSRDVGRGERARASKGEERQPGRRASPPNHRWDDHFEPFWSCLQNVPSKDKHKKSICVGIHIEPPTSKCHICMTFSREVNTKKIHRRHRPNLTKEWGWLLFIPWSQKSRNGF